jgi:hypothetical protein
LPCDLAAVVDPLGEGVAGAGQIDGVEAPVSKKKPRAEVNPVAPGTSIVVKLPSASENHYLGNTLRSRH